MVKRTLWERMTFAIALSLALHFAIVIGIEGRPSGPDAMASAPMTARLEPVGRIEPEPQAAEPKEELPAPAPVEQPAQDEQPAPNQASTAAHSAAVARKPQASEPSPAIDIPVIRDPTYYAARFLDVYPKPLGPIELRYPEQAAFTDLSGSVTLLLLIDDDGTLNEVSVVEAKPAAIFDEAALAAFRGMRFSPARKDGRAVRSRVQITVGFESNKPASSSAR